MPKKPVKPKPKQPEIPLTKAEYNRVAAGLCRYCGGPRTGQGLTCDPCAVDPQPLPPRPKGPAMANDFKDTTGQFKPGNPGGDSFAAEKRKALEEASAKCPLTELERMKKVYTTATGTDATNQELRLRDWLRKDFPGFQKRMMELESAATAAAVVAANPAAVAVAADEKSETLIKLVDDLIAEYESGVRK